MAPDNLNQWQEYVKSLKIEGRAFINGQYTAAQSEKTFACINPANSEQIAQIAECEEADAEKGCASRLQQFRSRNMA